MAKSTKDLLEFWEDQMKLSHTSSNYFFRNPLSNILMMFLFIQAFNKNKNYQVEKFKINSFKT